MTAGPGSWPAPPTQQEYLKEKAAIAAEVFCALLMKLNSLSRL